MGHRPRRPDLDRIAAHIDPDGVAGCWVWTGATYTNGYGQSSFEGVRMMAHRAVWVALVGAIGDGLVLDHLCRVRSCVNPDHLEPVTQSENVRRANGIQRATLRAKFAHITHCPAGHSKAAENIYTDPRTGKRRCIPCGRAASLACYHRRKQMAS